MSGCTALAVGFSLLPHPPPLVFCYDAVGYALGAVGLQSRFCQSSPHRPSFMGPPVANSYPFLNGSLACFYSWADTLSVQLPQLRWSGDLPPLHSFFFPASAVSLAPFGVLALGAVEVRENVKPGSEPESRRGVGPLS